MDIRSFVLLGLASLPRDAFQARNELFERADQDAKRISRQHDRSWSLRAGIIVTLLTAIVVVILRVAGLIDTVGLMELGVAALVGGALFFVAEMGHVGNLDRTTARDLVPNRTWMTQELTHETYEKYPAIALVELDYESNVLVGRSASTGSDQRAEIMAAMMLDGDHSIADVARALARV